MNVIEQMSELRHLPEWYVKVVEEIFSVHAQDSEHATDIVAKHLGFHSECDWICECGVELMFRQKGFSTRVRLPDGRYCDSLTAGYVREHGWRLRRLFNAWKRLLDDDEEAA